VLDAWGFGQKLSLGKGTTILFFGESGTGKTMAADIIANSLGLDIYKIDLSQVVSKYIGETEKNLALAFKDAESANAILFFDEADALFAKRTQVKDAHDRYANIETGYFLQKLDHYEGIVVLATNLKNNMDLAFTRRIAFSVVFPAPEEKERLQIWEKIWPHQTPREANLDFNFMAKQFKLNGGNIKNIAFMSAFLAADEDVPVAMRHIIHATKREIQKMGRVVGESDFGPYYRLVAA
jgi:SpoVK/Ycf46/Vps4 family AAA+-type ATPase